MKVLALGDTHGRTIWKEIVNKEKPGKVIFIGDYFDTHERIPAATQISNFKEIIEYKKSGQSEVVLLV